MTSVCEEKAKAQGYSHFSIRFYGICYGFKLFLNNARPPKSNCVNTSYKACDDLSSVECVGADWSEYVYLVGKFVITYTCIHIYT